MIWKCHHAFCDGVSVMSMTLALSEEYDKSYFIKTDDASWTQAIGVRLMAPLYLPKIIWTTLLAKTDTNFFMKKKTIMSGQLNISSSPRISVVELKDLSKKLKLTINDIILCAITTTLGAIFKQHGDNETTVNLMIPANIRFSFYKTAKDVKLENKFAAIAL